MLKQPRHVKGKDIECVVRKRALTCARHVLEVAKKFGAEIHQ